MIKIISIHVGHDGCVTYIKNNKIVFHTQIDRYNRFKHFATPTKSLIEELIKIDFDIFLISYTLNCDHWVSLWKDVIRNTKQLKNKKIIYSSIHNHHVYHAYCALTWGTKIKNTLVADGAGAPLNNATTFKIERESLYNEKKHLITEENKIGLKYEDFSKKHFEDMHACGKTMAWSLHDPRAKKIQIEFVTSMSSLINKWNIKKEIMFTGGCAQNILYNSKLLNKFKKVFCDPFNGDFGLSLGFANYYLNNSIFNNQIYLGIPQNLDTKLFNKYNIISVKPKDVAQILIDNPVAIFQSRSEQGQRGLGNRSLLMNPMHKDAHKKLNEIKKREWFRPFACSVLQEKAKDWFDMSIKESPHMMYVFKCKKKLKAGVAKDNNSRIQTVKKTNNLHYYNLIKNFDNLTKIPVLINTSLNLPGEVLVETMQDLKELFERSKLKFIYLPEINKLIKK